MSTDPAPTYNPYRAGDGKWRPQSPGQPQTSYVPPDAHSYSLGAQSAQQAQSPVQGGQPSYSYPPQAYAAPGSPPPVAAPNYGKGMHSPQPSGYGQPPMQSPQATGYGQSPTQSPPQQIPGQEQYFQQPYQQPQMAPQQFPNDPRAVCTQYGHVLHESFGIIGIILAVIFFPIGMVCCFIDKKKVCTRCGHVIDGGWSG